MTFPIFEAACVAVIALTLALMARTRPPRELLRDYAILAVAGWIGEETCIEGHRFYAYADGWHGFVGVVPVLVPLIWPLVILSARDVVSALAPGLGRGRRALAVAALVIIDASLVEIVAVRAGLWSWAEPGYLGVPVIGILGWGFFAAGAELVRGSIATIVVGPLAAHAMIYATWWACFRWTLRGALGDSATVAIVLLGVAAAAIAVQLRRRGRAMELSVAGPRMVAALLFVVVLVDTGFTGAGPLWLHAALVAVPYLVATRFTASRDSPADRLVPTTPFPQ